MTEFLWFTFFSAVSYFSIFHLMFNMFSFRMRDFVKEVVFSSLLLMFISYVLRYELGMAVIAPFAQMVMMILLLWLLFRVHLSHAVIMFSAWIIYLIDEQIIYSVLYFLGRADDGMDKLENTVISFAGSGLTIWFGYMLQRYGWHYSFVSDDPNIVVKVKGRKLLLLLLLFIEVVGFSVLYYLILFSTPSVVVPVSMVFLVVLIYVILLLNEEEVGFWKKPHRKFKDD